MRVVREKNRLRCLFINSKKRSEPTKRNLIDGKAKPKAWKFYRNLSSRTWSGQIEDRLP